MPADFGSFRFGWDAPARVGGSAVVLQEASELLPGASLHGSVPFLPTIVNGSAPSSTTSDGHVLWERTPSRCDLFFYQGDDVVIPLYFNDPALANDDMSAQQWVAQIRLFHRYQSRLISEFITKASFNTGTTEDDEHTLVELFLPRADNTQYGQYRWDLYSIADTDLSRFPKPDDVEATDWPPPDALRTWLYGVVTIAPRVTSTDVLVGSGGDALVPYPGPPVGVTVLTTGGWCVGPNGRVP